jgi:hypothetical protein
VVERGGVSCKEAAWLFGRVVVPLRVHSRVLKTFSASVAHLAGLEDSEDVCGAGLIGPPEAVFRTALTTHPWIFNLLKGNWIKVLTEAKRDGVDGEFIRASVSCTMGITSITASRGGRQGP